MMKGRTIMNMKYFRFLYGETAGCFVHFGELNDTFSGERVTFLYLSDLSGSRQDVKHTKSGTALFLCPEQVDLVVLGEDSVCTRSALRGILGHAEAGTLVIPEMPGKAGEMLADNPYPKAGNIIRLKPLDTDQDTDRGTDRDRDQDTDRDTDWDTDQNADLTCCEMKLAGWKFVMQCDENGRIMLLHAAEHGEFEDCVMSVKPVHGERKCLKTGTPDLYGCACGCALHRDHTVCKHRRADNTVPQRTGTLLVPGESGAAFEKLLEHERGMADTEIRFRGISPQSWKLSGCKEGTQEAENVSEVQYFIGVGSEVDEAALAEICRRSLNFIPVLVKEGQGICCSGFFKYPE